ncbi:hypothetical protein ALC57_09530 [Trachymyrmex cornetzi]|uniref:Uncharacterized protein n=1 Tax=Trachymyrmex cornetzi TaxID=471704 RepID=A0A195DZ68_9HYME|nr:hypothetical protein ALC57_09530 [Trachymyrmex cornetzi]
MYNVERHDGRIDITPVATQVRNLPEDSGTDEYAAGRSSLVDDVGVSPGRSVIRRGPGARRRCGSHHNSRLRPLSRGLAESWSCCSDVVVARSPVVTGGERREDVEEVESWRRAAAFSHFQSVSVFKLNNTQPALRKSLKPRSSESTPESADRSTTLVIVYKYGLADSPEILNGLSNSCKISI